jgi:hypothetical protein
MKIAAFVLSASVAALAFVLPATAHSAPTDDQSQTAEIMARGPDGRATIVRIAGQDYTVCTDQQQDSCIEPYAAGLKWADRPLAYWPGRPASQMHENPAELGG